MSAGVAVCSLTGDRGDVYGMGGWDHIASQAVFVVNGSGSL